MGRDHQRSGRGAGELSGPAHRGWQSQTQPLVVKRHPLRAATDADLQEQFDLAIRIRDKVTEANNAVIQIRNLKRKSRIG